MQQEKIVGKLTWVDLTDPTREEIEAIAARFELPPSIALSCIDPDHLPQVETTETTTLLILRAFDLSPEEDDFSIRGLTRKVSIIYKPGVLLTVHRSPLAYIQSVFESATLTEKKLVPELAARIFKTYDSAIAQIDDQFDDLEEAILDRTAPLKSGRVQELYTLKRKVTLLKKILRLTDDPFDDFQSPFNLGPARVILDKNLFKLEEVYDNLIAVISLQVSISDNRANEIMRVLTVISVLFLPLNLIAGIYGMNFEHMPELKWVHGYPMAICAMVTVACSILFWLKRKGWLQRPD